MNQKVIIGIVVVIILLGGGAYWYMNNQPNAVTTNTQSGENTPQSLKDLLGSNRPVKCDFNDENAQGTVYVSNGKVRGDFTTQTSGQTMRAHMIARDNKSYMWVDGMNTGFMSSMMLNNDTSANSGERPTSFDADKKLDYRCGVWTADESQFEVPTSIKFGDINSMMPTRVNTNVNAGTSAGANAPDCSVCDSAPAEARAQCRAALGC